jgi:hypothetical protein
MSFIKHPVRRRFVGQRPSEAVIAGSKPATEPDEKRKVITLKLPPSLLARIDLAAKRLNIHRTAYVLSTVSERLNRDRDDGR